MSRTVLIVTSKAQLLAQIVASMIESGWANDGAPTATILVGAADTEGRKPYIKLYEESSPNGVAMELGHARSGDSVVLPGTMAGPRGGNLAFVESVYHITATDRWVFAERCTNSKTGVLLGMLESPNTIGELTAPLIRSIAVTLSGGSLDPRIMRSTDSAIFIPNPATSPTGWYNSGTAMLGFWNIATLGVRSTGMTDRHFFRGRGLAGPKYPTTKWWLMGHDTHIIGYLKNVYLVHGLNSDSDKVTGFRVLIGGRYYHRASYDASNGMFLRVNGDESIAVMLPGELA